MPGSLPDITSAQNHPVRIVTLMLVLAHAGPAAMWLGSMGYSLFVVQPRLARALRDPELLEDVYRELGAGNRWRVVGLIAMIGVGGGALVAVRADGGDHDGGGWWWAAMAVKLTLWVAAATLFWWVSWRGWPARVFALPAELPAHQHRFRRVALALLSIVGAAAVVGVVARFLP
jgi:hypothetical protein